MKNKDIQTAD